MSVQDEKLVVVGSSVTCTASHMGAPVALSVTVTMGGRSRAKPHVTPSGAENPPSWPLPLSPSVPGPERVAPPQATAGRSRSAADATIRRFMILSFSRPCARPGGAEGAWFVQVPPRNAGLRVAHGTT
jgi:hypothetical protein